MAGDLDRRYDDPSTYQGRYPPDWEARRRSVYQRDEYTCQRCGERSGPHNPNSGVRLHAHHQTPLGNGGSNHPNNLVTLCEACHNAVHDHDITATMDDGAFDRGGEPVPGAEALGKAIKEAASEQSDSTSGSYPGSPLVVDFITLLYMLVWGIGAIILIGIIRGLFSLLPVQLPPLVQLAIVGAVAGFGTGYATTDSLGIELDGLKTLLLPVTLIGLAVAADLRLGGSVVPPILGVLLPLGVVLLLSRAVAVGATIARLRDRNPEAGLPTSLTMLFTTLAVGTLFVTLVGSLELATSVAAPLANPTVSYGVFAGCSTALCLVLSLFSPPN